MPRPNQTGERETDAAAKPTGGSFGGASESESPRAAAGDANASDEKENDARRGSRAKKKKKKNKKPPPTPAQACARTALLVHTLYSVTKEAEFEREGSAWPMLLASTDELLPAFVAMLAPPPLDAVGQKTPAAASDAAAAAALPLPEMLSELGRNALIVLAEMADPANSRVDPEAGARWAQHVVGERPDLVGLLIDIMGGGDPSAGRPRRRASGNAEAFTLSASSDAREAQTAYVSFAHRASLGRPSIPDPGEVADEEAGAAAESAGFLRFSVDEDRFALTSDCAHIAAAAVFGIVSHDECLETLLASLAKRTAREGGGSAGVSALVSRTRRLADALPRRRRREGKKKKASEEKGSNRTTALGENAGSNQTTALGSLRSGDAAPDADSDASSDSDAPDDAHQAACASGGAGVEAAGLIARFASHPGGRAALLDHAPGVVSYLLPCLRSELGQTAAFAARAVCALARSEDGARALLRFPRPDALSAALAGMLPRARLVGDDDHGGGPNDASRAAAARERRAWAELEIDPRRAFATDSFAFRRGRFRPRFRRLRRLGGARARRARSDPDARRGNRLGAPRGDSPSERRALAGAVRDDENARRGPPDRPPRRDDRSGERKRRGPDRSEPRGRGSTRARVALGKSPRRAEGGARRETRVFRGFRRGETRIPLAETPGSPSRGNGNGRPPVGNGNLPRRTRGGAGPVGGGHRRRVARADQSVAVASVGRSRRRPARAPRADRSARGDTLRGGLVAVAGRVGAVGQRVFAAAAARHGSRFGFGFARGGDDNVDVVACAYSRVVFVARTRASLSRASRRRVGPASSRPPRGGCFQRAVLRQLSDGRAAAELGPGPRPDAGGGRRGARGVRSRRRRDPPARLPGGGPRRDAETRADGERGALERRARRERPPGGSGDRRRGRIRRRREAAIVLGRGESESEFEFEFNRRRLRRRRRV